MKKNVISIFLLSAISSQSNALTNSKFGLDYLRSNSSVACDNVNDTIINPLWSKSCTEKANGYRLSYAYEFNKTYSIEVSYIDLGDVEWYGEFQGFPNGPDDVETNERVKFGAKGLGVSLRAAQYIGNAGGIYGQIGLAHLKGSYNSSLYYSSGNTANTTSTSDSETNISPFLGVGYFYEFLEISFTLYKDVGTGKIDGTNIPSVGLGLRF